MSDFDMRPDIIALLVAAGVACFAGYIVYDEGAAIVGGVFCLVFALGVSMAAKR